MPVRNILCISIDGLRASALGAYGNTWHPTPALDAIASRSTVYEWMFCERPTADGFFQAIWRTGVASLAQRLAAAGVHTALTTDDLSVAERGEASGFAEVRQLDFMSRESAATTADTELAQLFAVAIDQFASWGGNAPAESSLALRRLLWVHARGYHGSWDAPMELRESLLDDDDPPAPTFVAPPTQAGVRDHDELLLYRTAYAGQTMALDECIGALTAAMTEFGLDQNTLVVLVGAQGYALGEHHAIGAATSALYSEQIHVPCLVYKPGVSCPPPREMRLSQLGDLYELLLAIVDSVDSLPAGDRDADLQLGEPRAERQFLISTSEDGEAAIRTPAWMLRRPTGATSHEADGVSATGSAPAIELYFKPDDRWEANEVAARMPEVASRLLAILESSLSADDPSPLQVPLDDDLAVHPR